MYCLLCVFYAEWWTRRRNIILNIIIIILNIIISISNVIDVVVVQITAITAELK